MAIGKSTAPPRMLPGCSHDSSDSIHGFEQEIVERHLAPRVADARRRGLPLGLANGCRLSDLAVSVRASDWMHVTLNRAAHLSEGTNYFQTGSFRMDDPEVDRIFDGFIGEISELMCEDRDIRQAGGRPATPGAEHARIHPLVAHVLKKSGVGVEQVLGYKRGAGRRPVRNLYGIDMEQVSLENEDAGIFMSHHLRHRRVMCSVTAGMTGSGFYIRLVQEPSRLIMSLPGCIPPATIMNSIQGMMVGDVVVHPLLEGCPPVIVRNAMEWSDDTLALEIEPADVTIAEAWRNA